MKKFMVLYMAPAAEIEEWMKKPQEERAEAEKTMMAEWQAWMKSHAGIFADMGGGLGKTKRLTKGNIADAKNDLMLYALVNAESVEEAAEMFKDHPHFGIPNASIEIMEARAMGASM